MVTHDLYNAGPDTAYSGGVNLGNGVTVALLTSSHTPDLSGNTTFADVSANEASGTGYTAGGQALTNVSWSGLTLSADDALWQDSSITAAYAVVYESTSETLLSLVDFEGDETSDNGDFLVEWNNGNIFSVSV